MYIIAQHEALKKKKVINKDTLITLKQNSIFFQFSQVFYFISMPSPIPIPPETVRNNFTNRDRKQGAYLLILKIKISDFVWPFHLRSSGKSTE